MNKYINAEQLEKDGWTMQRTYKSSPTEMTCEMKKPTDFPAADVAEVKHGKWKIIKYPTGVEAFGYKEMTVQSLMCSNCSYEIDVSEGYFEYCPNCGSFMDLEYEEDE